MSDDDDSVWAPVLSAHSTRTDLEHAIRKWTEWSLTETRAMLADEPRLTDALRLAIMTRLEPVIRHQTRAALESGYARIRPVH